MVDIINGDVWRNRWYSFSAPYGRLTGDDREFTHGALSHRQFPMPICLQIRSGPNHVGAVVVGAIDDWASTDLGVLTAGTWMDPDSVPEVKRALALVAAGLARPSVDLEPGTISAEVVDNGRGGKKTIYHSAVVAGITIVPIAAFDGTFVRMPDQGNPEPGDDENVSYSDDGGTFALTGTKTWRTLPIATRETVFNSDESFKRILAWANGSDEAARSMFLWFDPNQAEGVRDRYRLPLGDIVNGKPTLTYHAIYSASALISGAHGGLPTVSDEEKSRMKGVITEIYTRMSGAFGDPTMTAPWDAKARAVENSRTASIVASATPVKPPRSWFSNPNLKRPSPLIVRDDGRVYGHLALWDTCHVGLGQLSGECVKAPHSATGYAMFHTGNVATDSGDVIPVGRLTVDTTHPAGQRGAMLTAASASQHYDNTGACAAIVTMGEDEHGIWFAGSMVPEAGEMERAKLRRHPLSGDWRDVNGNLELVAALSVNSPGFPIVRMVDGNRFTLVASMGACDMIDGMSVDTEDPVVPSQPVDVQPDPTVSAPTVSPADIARMVSAEIDNRRATAARTERLATLATVEHSARLGRLFTLPKPEVS
jgi:hypothetical protein